LFKPIIKGHCTLLELKTVYSIDDLQELHFAIDEIEEMEGQAHDT